MNKAKPIRIGSYSRILLFNALLIGMVLLAAEAFLRLQKIGFLRSCFTNCEFERLWEALRPDQYVGLARFDPVVGYTPNPGFARRLNRPDKGYDDVFISIDQNTLRNSATPESWSDEEPTRVMLTVGDSYAFGDQVSDADTWQSCLNRQDLGIRVLNGGVFGYGAAQAVLRASLLEAKLKPDIILISNLVGFDFERDRLDFRSGFPRPAVIEADGTFRLSDVPVDARSDVGSKFSNRTAGPLSRLMASSELVNRLLPDLAADHAMAVQKRLTRYHPEAASKADIIRWTVRRSKSLGADVVWLLQYHSTVPEGYEETFREERTALIAALKANNVPYIDTYDALHGKDRSFNRNSTIWTAHHTPLGNELVCREIIASNLLP